MQYRYINRYKDSPAYYILKYKLTRSFSIVSKLKILIFVTNQEIHYNYSKVGISNKRHLLI